MRPVQTVNLPSVGRPGSLFGPSEVPKLARGGDRVHPKTCIHPRLPNARAIHGYSVGQGQPSLAPVLCSSEGEGEGQAPVLREPSSIFHGAPSELRDGGGGGGGGGGRGGRVPPAPRVFSEPKEANNPRRRWLAPGLGVSSGCVFANKKSCAFGRKGDLFVCTLVEEETLM